VRERVPVDASANSVVERLYDTEFVSLTRYATSIVGARAEAEDLVQEAFIILLATPPIDDAGRISAWLRVVLRRLCVDVLRRRKLGIDKEASAQRVYVSVNQPSAETETLRAVEIESVRKRLTELPERDRTVLLMRHSGYSYREIAAVLGVETAVVGVMLLRAMKKWRQISAEQGEDVSTQSLPAVLRLDTPVARQM